MSKLHVLMVTMTMVYCLSMGHQTSNKGFVLIKQIGYIQDVIEAITLISHICHTDMDSS